MEQKQNFKKDNIDNYFVSKFAREDLSTNRFSFKNLKQQ